VSTILDTLDQKREYLLVYNEAAELAGWCAAARLSGRGPGYVGPIGEPVRLTSEA
jgi:hypothetical protein